jgi:hypothetical protein
MKGIGEGKKGRQNFSFTGISLIIPLIFVTGIIFIGSCTKMSEFTIGKDFFESQTKIEVIDTFRVDMSTIIIDSLITSSTGKAYVGNYKDDLFGEIKCESYFDLKYQSFSEIEEKAIFDSAVFILPFSGDSYGDTTSLMSFSIHKLTEKITPFEDNYLYSNTSFSYEPDAVGTVNFYPEPHSLSDSTVIVHAAPLGEELFNYIKDKDERVSSDEWFKDYLKGFILTPGTSENNAVIGIDAAEGKIRMEIYYHLESLEPIEKVISIPMGYISHQFNNVSYDLTNTSLYNIKDTKNEVSFSETGYKAYMQGLIGLLPKIQFPTMKDILEKNRWKILQAELVLEPVKSSFDVFTLPKELYLYETDKQNRINSVVKNKNDNSKSLVASFEYDELYNENTRYSYDITTFINDELSDGDFDSRHGLLIGLEAKEFRSSLDRLLVEGKKPPVKLVLYYLSY